MGKSLQTPNKFNKRRELLPGVFLTKYLDKLLNEELTFYSGSLIIRLISK